MPAITSAPSAICGTHFGETNEADSTLRKPAADKRLINSILIAVGTNSFSFCSPSRGPTSTILTRWGKAMMSLPCNEPARGGAPSDEFGGVQTPRSVSTLYIDHTAHRFATHQRRHFPRDLRDALFAQGQRGNMRRNRD